MKGTIKTFDRAEEAAHRIKDGSIRTKESAEGAYQAKEDSPSGYAQGSITEAGKSATVRAGRRLQEMGKKETRDTLQRLTGRSRAGAVRQEKYTGRAAAKKTVKAVRPSRSIQVKSIQSARKRMFVRKRQQAMMQRKATVKTVKIAFVNTVRAVKLAASGMKVLVSAIICCLFGGALYLFGDSSNTGYIPVSEEVEQYSPLISKYAKEYGINEYTELIKAVMMQESGGRGSDPMRASECGYNTKYPHSPGAIKDPEYSIKCGVQMLASVLKAAGCESPSDMEHIKLALQIYHMGAGKARWIQQSQCRGIFPAAGEEDRDECIR